MSLSTRLIGLVGTLWATHFFSPEDAGTVNAVVIVLMSANVMSSLGIGPFLLSHPNEGRETWFQATFIHISLGVAVLGTITLFRHSLGPIFQVPMLWKYAPALALSLFFDRVSFVPERVLIREMHYRKLAVFRSAAEIAYTSCMLAFAVTGSGAVAIVYGNVARSLLKLVLIAGSVNPREWLTSVGFDRETLKRMAAYSGVLYAGSVAGYGVRNWDNQLVGHYFGAAAQGLYANAYQLADVPAVQVGEQITDVLFASFPRLEPERRVPALLRAIKLLSLVMAPLAVGLGVVGPTLALVLLSKKWAYVGTMLMVLSGLSLPRPIAGVLSAYLQVRAGPKLVTAIDLGSFFLLLGFIATIGRFGILYTCAAVGLTFAVRASVLVFFVKRLDGVPIRSFLSSIVPPVLATLPLLISVLVVRAGLEKLDVQSGVLRLALEIAAGALAYIAAALVLARETSMDFLGLLRSAARRRKATPLGAATP